MNEAKLRMDNGLVEIRENGLTYHAEVNDLRSWVGDKVTSTLLKEGQIQVIFKDDGPYVEQIITIK